MKLEENLAEMERAREAYWLRYPSTSPFKLEWRAIAVRHCFHVLPGERILELGAGSGLWTEHLTEVLRGENPIVATVFNDDFAAAAATRRLPNVTFEKVTSLADLPAESFDYIVGTAILCHDMYALNLRALLRLLKPGGQILFFEANYWNPQAIVKRFLPQRWVGQAPCQVSLRKYKLMQIASQQGFIDLDVIPYDIIHLRLAFPRFCGGTRASAEGVVWNALHSRAKARPRRRAATKRQSSQSSCVVWDRVVRGALSQRRNECRAPG
jgi:SAM-dependent methyltransferase